MRSAAAGSKAKLVDTCESHDSEEQTQRCGGLWQQDKVSSLDKGAAQICEGDLSTSLVEAIDTFSAACEMFTLI